MRRKDIDLIGPRFTRGSLALAVEEAPGSVCWNPHNIAVYHSIEEYIRRSMREAGFLEVNAPQTRTTSSGHIELFRGRTESYRDLPVRIAELSACRQPPGELPNSSTMDAHVICLLEHADNEIARCCELLRRVYAWFGFDKFLVGLSTRPAARNDGDASWDAAEDLLLVAARRAGLAPRLQPNEEACGPKLEFILEDRDGREWPCGTIQSNLTLPEVLGIRLVDVPSTLARPIVIHHTVLGGIERFAAVLLHHHRDRLRFWLAPATIGSAPAPTASNDAPPRRLSTREEQVVLLAAQGLSNKYIAYELGVAHATVRVLMARAASKLGSRSRSELIAHYSNGKRQDRVSTAGDLDPTSMDPRADG